MSRRHVRNCGVRYADSCLCEIDLTRLAFEPVTQKK